MLKLRCKALIITFSMTAVMTLGNGLCYVEPEENEIDWTAEESKTKPWSTANDNRSAFSYGGMVGSDGTLARYANPSTDTKTARAFNSEEAYAATLELSNPGTSQDESGDPVTVTTPGNIGDTIVNGQNGLDVARVYWGVKFSQPRVINKYVLTAMHTKNNDRPHPYNEEFRFNGNYCSFLYNDCCYHRKRTVLCAANTI